MYSVGKSSEDYSWGLININGYNVEIGDDLAKKLEQKKPEQLDEDDEKIYHWDNV